MNDYKIVIDPGHGGIDSGANGNGIIEKDLTLKISEYIYNRLKELKIPVAITRTTDETLNPTDRVNRILSFFGNNPNVIVVSNHINAGGGDGAEVIYALRNNDTLAKSILGSLEQTGQNVRGVYQRRLPSDPSKDYYFIHRNTGITEPVIIEYGFLDSKLDDVNQLKNNYEQLAEATVKALANYIGIDYTLPNTNLENTYIVKSGDSLWSIAKKYGVTVNEIKQANNLSSNLLKIGQQLIIPKEEIIEEQNSTYIVKPGDTLYKIANTYNTSVAELKNKNNLTNNTLSIGQILIIPNEIENEQNEYVVQPGDTLYKIANEFGITQQELMDINNLTSNLLSIGQILKIPNKKQIIYIVKPKDTLYKIANTYNTTVDDIKNKNNLTSNSLSIGQQLII